MWARWSHSLSDLQGLSSCSLLPSHDYQIVSVCFVLIPLQLKVEKLRIQFLWVRCVHVVSIQHKPRCREDSKEVRRTRETDSERRWRHYLRPESTQGWFDISTMWLLMHAMIKCNFLWCKSRVIRIFSFIQLRLRMNVDLGAGSVLISRC